MRPRLVITSRGIRKIFSWMVECELQNVDMGNMAKLRFVAASSAGHGQYKYERRMSAYSYRK